LAIVGKEMIMLNLLANSNLNFMTEKAFISQSPGFYCNNGQKNTPDCWSIIMPTIGSIN